MTTYMYMNPEQCDERTKRRKSFFFFCFSLLFSSLSLCCVNFRRKLPISVQLFICVTVCAGKVCTKESSKVQNIPQKSEKAAVCAYSSPQSTALHFLLFVVVVLLHHHDVCVERGRKIQARSSVFIHL